ncbi:MAG: SGNH/GDSL hydrolase family protein [Hahellaceae bacterium]|nr:SGNH/GDSL hydrolase family protein [Hahellaceae bacterium]MCP5169922.1 SGNH/GDSL hydrolase family protein [Hahellaceae bacterium]
MKTTKLFATLAFSACASFAQADFSEIYVFGDSLSDIGNLKAVTQDPAIPERFTNGPVAVEVLAAGLGHSLTASYHLLPPALTGGVYGNNYAIAGAKAIDEDGNEATPDINLPTQVNAFLQIHGGMAPEDALYVVLIGGNDIRGARDVRASAAHADSPVEREAIRKAANDLIAQAVDAEQAQIEKLIGAGARHVMVLNAPDIGAIPESDLIALQAGQTAETRAQARKAERLPAIATKLSAKYNRQLARKLARTEHRTGVDIIEFDLFGFLTSQIDDAEDFGYTNTDDACIYVFSQGGTVNPECSDFPVATGFLFWDEIHPTAAAHQRAGQAVLSTLAQ